MTQQQILQSTTYQRAIARADAEQIHITGHDACAFHVSGSTGNIYHVRVKAGSLVCDCPAAENGLYCKHRAVVTRQLIDLVFHPKLATYPYLIDDGSVFVASAREIQRRAMLRIVEA